MHRRHASYFMRMLYVGKKRKKLKLMKICMIDNSEAVMILVILEASSREFVPGNSGVS